MTNLSSILVLLQLVLTLLSNPSTANSSQAQTLATQAIGYATQALESQATTSQSVAPQVLPTNSSATTTIISTTTTQTNSVEPPQPISPFPVISGVRTVEISGWSAQILWNTDRNSDSVAYFGTSSGIYSASTTGFTIPPVSGNQNPNLYGHAANLSNLASNTTYYYTVSSKDGLGNKATSIEYSFTTSPASALTLSKDNSSLTPNIITGQTGVVLAKFDAYAKGEPIRVQYLTFQLAFTGATTTLSNMIKNIRIVDDAGNTLGTIATPPSMNTCDINGSSVLSGFDPSGTTYTDCFNAPQGYLPANTTRVISLEADIQPTATFSTVTASLTGNHNNLQGLESGVVSSSGAISGNAMELSAN